MLRITDELRQCYHALAAVPGTDLILQRAKVLIEQLGQAHKNMILEHSARSDRFYSAVFLLDCFLYAGFLSSQRDMAESLLLSIRVTLPYISQREHCLKMLQSDWPIPSSTTMYKHRLMFACGVYKHLAGQASQMLEGGPVVQWGTWDSSPQGGWGWLMHGRIRVHVSDCVCLLIPHISFKFPEILDGCGRGAR